MRSLKRVLSSPRLYVIFVAAVVIAAFIFPEFFDSLLLGGSLYPLGIFQRLIIALIVGACASLVSFASYMLFAFMWQVSFDDPQAVPRTKRQERGNDRYGGGQEQGVDAAAAGWTSESLSISSESAVSDRASVVYGYESGGFGGGDAGGGGSGGDFGGGDSGGGDGGGGGD